MRLPVAEPGNYPMTCPVVQDFHLSLFLPFLSHSTFRTRVKMSAFSNNPFALLGEEETETDKLGNTKPVEKKKEEPTTRAAKRDAERKRQGRVAGMTQASAHLCGFRYFDGPNIQIPFSVSPPSARRGRDRGLSQPDDSRRGEKTESGPVDIVEAGGSRPGYAGNRPTRYHREHDRQSGTGL